VNEREALKGCPFCGNPVEPPARADEFGDWRVSCWRCEVAGPERKSRDEALAAWNTRPETASLAARAERAEAERDRLARACDEIVDWARIGAMDEWGKVEPHVRADLDEARAAIDAVLGLTPARGTAGEGTS
jgi:Lar family restriction alleviation protein